MTERESIQQRDRLFTEIAASHYDPLLGKGSTGIRVSVLHPAGCHVDIPREMLDDPDYSLARRNALDFDILRSKYDFEFWAVKCCTVRDKSTGHDIPFCLNTPQRYVTARFEDDRRAGRPMRFIMLKARQWGGSTLVQMYMAWIQCTQRENWNSLICSHVKDTSATIRGMYNLMLDRYPREMWLGTEGSAPCFKPFERSNNIREIQGRGGRVTIGSSENQEAVRGADYAMAHLSEVAFWASTPTRSPEDFVRAICGSVNIAPLTFITMESTANGMGNYFHKEWLRAEAGLSDKKPLFIPWYYMPIYSLPLQEPPEKFLESIDDYEQRLIDLYGCTLEQVYWYHCKRREYTDHAMMQAEFPTCPVEAFANTGFAVFDTDDIERARQECIAPATVGEMTGPVVTGPESLENMTFDKRRGGRLKIWKHPERDSMMYESRYIVAVDIGGRSRQSDFSVIAVFDRVATPGRLELVAQWRGHCDHDILAWKAAAIARWYCDAHLVYESNTLETDNTDGDPSTFILNEISEHYSNLYYRTTSDTATGALSRRPGFHTNRATKTAAITRLNAALRDSELIERDSDACDEYSTYVYMPNGTQGATPGNHDDILITRAIALSAAVTLPDPLIYLS